VNKHLLCLTVDTDPDGLSGKVTDRRTLEWQGLEALKTLPAEMHARPELESIPITWFIRADGQLESILGSPSYLLEKFNCFWSEVSRNGHELAWHPHLYRQSNVEHEPRIISRASEAQEELERLWDELKDMLPATSFRNGEGWHTPETYSTVESLGFRCDSTAIPNRKGAHGHPMNWAGAPNQPYFPHFTDLCADGKERRLLELPMNTWLVKAPYDAEPKLRYMNPAVHPGLFARAVQDWEKTRKFSYTDLHVWVMIFHPDEVLPGQHSDQLYERSRTALFTNLLGFQESLQRAEVETEWVTIEKAAEFWRRSRLKQTA